jgi:hypothetical protein
MSDKVKTDLTKTYEDEDSVEYEDDDVINEDPTALKEESIPNEFREHISQSKQKLYRITYDRWSYFHRIGQHDKIYYYQY